jgi:hypothetical protein
MKDRKEMMADFITVLQNRDKKWRLPKWDLGKYIVIGNNCISTPTGHVHTLSQRELFSDDWEEYKEPEKLKVFINVTSNGDYFYFSINGNSIMDKEATPEQLAQIRKALGL